MSIKFLTLSCAFFVMLGFHKVYSQDEEEPIPEIRRDDRIRNNKIGLRTGFIAFTLKDRVITNFVYNGSSLPFVLEYVMNGQESRQKFSLGFTGVDLKTEVYKGFSYTGEIIKEENDSLPVKIGTVQTAFINIKYNYLGTVHTSQNEKFKFLLGGGFDYYLISKQFRSIEYINSITDNISTFSFYGATKYSPSEKNTFELSLSLPLITFMNRTLRLQEGEPDLYEFKKWVTLNRMFGFATNINYNFRFAKRWSLEADYSFLYYQYPFPRKVQLGMHSATVGINFHF